MRALSSTRRPDLRCSPRNVRRALPLLLTLFLASWAAAQAPTLLVEYHSFSSLRATGTTIRVMSNGFIQRSEDGRHGPITLAQNTLSAADLARVRTAVQAARIAPQAQRHVGPMRPDPVSESMTLPRRARQAWTSGDTPAPAVTALRDLLMQLSPLPPPPSAADS